jgi:hypothetical protein
MYSTTENRGMICQFEELTVQPTMMMVVEEMPHRWASVMMRNREDPQSLYEDSGGCAG